MKSLILILLLAVLGQPSFAANSTGTGNEEWTDIQSQVDQAMVQYYHEIKFGKGRSYAERVSLWKEIVGPSEQKAQDFQIKIPGDFVGRSQNSAPAPSAGKPNASPSPSNLDPVYELDGSKLPKELNFSKP